jgi:hypothetical protein
MYNAFKVFPVTLASAATLAGPIDLGGHAWDRILVQVPTHASGGTHYVRTGGTLDDADMYPLYKIDPADGGQNIVQFIGANGLCVEVGGGLRFVSIENTSGIANGASYKILCS